MNIQWKGSPNFTAGRGRHRIEFIVVHWIVGTLTSAKNTFAKASSQVSAHYGVGQNRIYQFVRDEDTAWHAGNFNANQRSIGIEHEGGPNLPITDAVYTNSAWLIAQLRRRYGNIPLKPHRAFVATQCPGTLDLARLDRMANEILNPPSPPLLPSDPDPCLSVKNDLQQAIKERDEGRVIIAAKDTKLAELEAKIKYHNELVKKIKELSHIAGYAPIEDADVMVGVAIKTIEQLRNNLKTCLMLPRNELLPDEEWLVKLWRRIKYIFRDK